MFLSCVFHVSHVAIGVKLFLQIKALEMLDPGHSLLWAHRGPHSRTVAAGSDALGKLWAPLLYALFKGGHWRPSSVTVAWDTHDKAPALEMRKKGCLQSVRLLNKSEMKRWVFFLRHWCIICLSVLAILISIYNMGISVSKADAVLYKWLFSHFSMQQQKCSFLLFFLHKGC